MSSDASFLSSALIITIVVLARLEVRIKAIAVDNNLTSH